LTVKGVAVTGNLVTVTSPTSLTFMTPAVSGQGPTSVTVTNLDGQTASLASALDFEAAPVFLTTLASATVPPFSVSQQTVSVIDPRGAPVSFSISTAPGLAVITTGAVTFVQFLPVLFDAGTYPVTLTATSNTGTSRESATFTVPRASSPQILFSDNAVFLGAPGGRGLAWFANTDRPLGARGQYASDVGFVGTSTGGVLYRQTIAGVGSTVTVRSGRASIEPFFGISIVATTGGPAPNLPGVTVNDVGGALSCAPVGADGLCAFTAQITSDSGTTTATALYLCNEGAVSGPFLRRGLLRRRSEAGRAASLPTSRT